MILFFTEGEIYQNPEVLVRMETLRKRHLVHAGVIEIQEGGKDRQGWNIVLVRVPDSMYGEWRLVESRLSPLSGKTAEYEPFATDASLLADNLACHWATVMHVFNLTDKRLTREDLIRIFDIFIP